MAICIPPSQYNNRISHGSSMWNFKFNRSQQKQQKSQWSRRHLQSANLCCWWVEDYWVKSALKCGRLSLLSNWSFEKFRPYFSTIVTWHLAFCRCPLTEFEYLFKLLKPISSHSIELYFGASRVIFMAALAILCRFRVKLLWVGNVFEKRKNQSQIMHKTSLSPCQTQCILCLSESGFHFFLKAPLYFQISTNFLLYFSF